MLCDTSNLPPCMPTIAGGVTTPSEHRCQYKQAYAYVINIQFLSIMSAASEELKNLVL